MFKMRWMLGLTGPAGIAMLLLTGCASKRPVLTLYRDTPVMFKNCQVTARDPGGKAISCRCIPFAAATDAKTGAVVALCAN